MSERRYRAVLVFALLSAAAHGQDGPAEPDPARAALAFHQMGSTCEKAGQMDDAEMYYARSIAAWEKAYGPAHPGLARLLNILASTQLADKRYGKAERTSERSLGVLAGAPGVMPAADHARALIHLGAARVGLGKYEEAESAYREAESMLRKEAAPADRMFADLWNNVGALHARRKAPAKAAFYLEEALRVQGDACTGESVLTAANLSAVEASQRRFQSAEMTMRRAAACAGEAFGPEHPKTAEVLSGYGAILRRLNRKGDAERVEAQAAAIRASARERDRSTLIVDARELQGASRKTR
jgi:tetratricopeptide (TPR) repeat protein